MRFVLHHYGEADGVGVLKWIFGVRGAGRDSQGLPFWELNRGVGETFLGLWRIWLNVSLELFIKVFVINGFWFLSFSSRE